MTSTGHNRRLSSKANTSSINAATKRSDVHTDGQSGNDGSEPKRVKLSTDVKNKPVSKGSEIHNLTTAEPSSAGAIDAKKMVDAISDASTISNDGRPPSVAPGNEAIAAGSNNGPVCDQADQDVPMDGPSKPVSKSPVKYKLVVGPSRQHVTLLPRVRELSISFGESEPSMVVPFVLKDELENCEPKARRIFNIAVHMEGFNMQNIFSADPRRFKYLVVGNKNDSCKIVNAKNNVDATFFTVGVVTESTLFGGKYGKEIDIKPLARIWPRSHSVISQLLKFNDVVMPAYKDGIQFSTFRKPAEGAREIKARAVPMDGKTHGPPVRNWDAEVPVFRGLEPFKLTEYMKLDPIYNELKQGDYVLVAFTVGGYRTKDINRVSLNIQFAILLAKHDYTDNHSSSDEFPDDLADESALGVDDPTPMVVPKSGLIDWAESDAEYPDGPEF